MILLDTHVWWWAISEPDKLSAMVKRIIDETPPSEICVASISLWEFAMMAARCRIILNIHPKEWLNNAIESVGTTVLPLTAEIALESCNLPGNFHKDPADRIITATARINNALLITKDEKILNYPEVKTIW